jgi:hypothetical protein
VFVGLVGSQIDPVVLLQATERLKQTILSIARDRLCLALAPRLKLAACDPRPLAPPATPATLAEHQLGIDLDVLLGLLRADRAALALLDPPLGVLKRGLAALRGAQLLGQLIAPRIAKSSSSRRSVSSASRRISLTTPE